MTIRLKYQWRESWDTEKLLRSQFGDQEYFRPIASCCFNLSGHAGSQLQRYRRCCDTSTHSERLHTESCWTAWFTLSSEKIITAGEKKLDVLIWSLQRTETCPHTHTHTLHWCLSWIWWCGLHSTVAHYKREENNKAHIEWEQNQARNRVAQDIKDVKQIYCIFPNTHA